MFSKLERSKEYVGRHEEIRLLLETAKQVANAPICRALYFEAQGGLGKTRLLEDSPQLIKMVSRNFFTSDLVDMYDYANRETTWIERRLVLGLRQQHPQQTDRLPRTVVDQYFRAYYETYEQYTSNQSASSSILLTRAFIRCWNNLAQEYPLLIRFDTLEKLFTHQPNPDALATDEDGINTSVYVVDWLRHLLTQLKHTLFLFSGRPVAENRLLNMLYAEGVLASEVRVFQPLLDLDVVQEYLVSVGAAFDASQLEHIRYITEGRPLLLTCYAERQNQRLPLLGEPQNRLEFEDLLLDTILNPLAQTDAGHRTLAYCLYVLSYARRGIRRADLQRLFARLGLAPEPAVIESLGSLALIKTVQARGLEATADDDLLLLHDEIYQLLDDSGRPDALGLREQTLAFLCERSHQLVSETGGHGPLLLAAMSDHVYYMLTYNLNQGYRCYAEYMDYLLMVRYEREALILSDVFWGTLTYRTLRNGQECYPYLDTLAQEPLLTYQMIRYDEQIRRLKLYHSRDRLALAVQLADQLEAAFHQEGFTLTHPTDTNVASQYHTLVDFELTRAAGLLRHNPHQLEQLAPRLADLIAKLENTPIERFQVNFFLLLSRAYKLYGDVLFRLKRCDPASKSYETGMDRLRTFQIQAISTVMLPPAWYLYLEVRLSAGLALSFAWNGQLERANQLIQRALERARDQQVSSYDYVLLNHSCASIALLRDDHDQANTALRLAKASARLSGVLAILGLVQGTEAVRDSMLSDTNPVLSPEIENFYAEALRLLQNDRTNSAELLADRACASCGGVVYSTMAKQRLAEHWQQAMNEVDVALESQPTAYVLRRAELLERQAMLYTLVDQLEAAGECVRQAEALLAEPLPCYAQVICARIALLRALWSQHTDDVQRVLEQIVCAFARAYLFARRQAALNELDLVVRQLLPGLPHAELRHMQQRIKLQQCYISIRDLRMQLPAPALWIEAWDSALQFVNLMIEQILDRETLTLNYEL